MKTHLARRGVSRHSLALLVACCAASVAVGAETGPPAGDPSQPVCDYTANARIIEKGENLALQVDEKIEVRNTSVQELEVSLPIHNQEIKDSLKLSVDGKPVDEVSGLTVPPGSTVNIAAVFEQSRLAPRTAITITLPPDYWFPTLAHTTPGRDSYKVKLDVPPGYAVAASGVCDPQTGIWSAESLRNFGVVLLKNGDVLEKDVHGTLVRCLHFESQKEAAQLVFDTAADVIAFYKGRFGFYPFKSLTIVPGDSRPMGGYPFASCIVVIHGMENFKQKPEIHWRWITAHEIGHQYWGEHVLSSSNVNWLMIGLGIYADREYVRARKLGNSRHKAILSRYVDGIRSHLDTTVEFKKRPSFDFNNVVVHGKGYSIISALACLLGEETFARIHNRCLREYAGKAMYAEDFRAVCEREGGRDLKSLFDQWLRTNRFLSYTIESSECEAVGTEHRSTITVKRLGDLTMPVPVTATFADGSVQCRFTDPSEDPDSVLFTSKSKLKEAVIDPKGELPLVVPPPQRLKRPKIVTTKDLGELECGVLYATEGNLFLVDPLKGKRIDLTWGRTAEEGWSAPWGPCASPAGTKVVYYQFKRDGTGQVKLYLVDVAKSTIRCVPGYSKSYQFSWAPDGRRLTFVDAGQPPALVILDTESLKKKTIELSDVESGRFTSHWSPDGKCIAVSSTASIRLCDPETGEVREVVKGSLGSRICWSPDSRRLATILDSKLTIIECNGQLVEHHGRADSVDDWSSDGELIVYEKHRVKKEVWILAIASGNTSRVDWKAACCAGRWAPDGNHLAFWNNSMLMMTGRDGTHPVVIGETTGGTMPPSWLELVPAKGAK